MPTLTEIPKLLSEYGWQAVIVAAVLYMLIYSEIEFRYPRQKSARKP